MKKVFITGAGGGIGKALCKKFSQEGYYVVGQYRKNAPEFCKEKIRVDFSDMRQVEKAADILCKRHPDLTVLINNAGCDHYGLFTDMTAEEISNITTINLLSAMTITAKVGKNMVANGAGSIINISSIWGRDGGSCEAAYSATKGGLISFTKAIAKEWGLMNVRANALCLGFIDTPMNARFTEEDKKAFCEGVALGRIGTPEEVAEAAFFLASDKASYITGQILSVDGGM